MTNKKVKYNDLKIGQRVWFNIFDDDDPVYIPLIIDEIVPSKCDEEGYAYVHGTADDGTGDKYKIYFEEIVVEEPKKEYQQAMENELENNSEILHITKSKFNELLKEAIKEHISISTQSTINGDGFIETYTDVYFDDELIAHYK